MISIINTLVASFGNTKCKERGDLLYIILQTWEGDAAAENCLLLCLFLKTLLGLKGLFFCSCGKSHYTSCGM